MHSPENNYQRDGLMRVDANGGSGPNYWPNSFCGPAPDPGFLEPPFNVLGLAAHTPYTHPNDDFVQPGNLYRDVMIVQNRENLVGNIASHLSGAQKRIQLRQTALFFKADPDYGSHVAKCLGLDIKEVEHLANMTTEERARATEKKLFWIMSRFAVKMKSMFYGETDIPTPL
jgi:catalase